MKKIAVAALFVFAASCHSSTRSEAANSVATGSSDAPGAALKCDSSGQNAFATYGAQAFVAINQSLVANVKAELTANGPANLGTSFSKVGSGNPPSTKDDGPTFRGKLAAFLAYIYGGPASSTYIDGKSYPGPQEMRSAHAGLGITSAQYDYFVANLVVPALLSNGVKHGSGGAGSPDDVGSCFTPALNDPAFKASFVGQ
jgi:hypothetical protein